MPALQKFPRRQFNVSHICLISGASCVHSRSHAQNAYRSHIPFQQGVCSLCRTVSDKRHILRCNPVFFHQCRDNFYYTVSNALRMRRRYFLLRQHLICTGIYHNSIRKSSAHINTNPYFSVHNPYQARTNRFTRPSGPQTLRGKNLCLPFLCIFFPHIKTISALSTA